jgi:hypothetical protein
MHALRALRSVVLAACLALSSLSVGCQEPPTFDPDVTGAFNALVGAVRAKDGGKLWELSPASMHTAMQSLYERQRRVVEAVRSAYPQTDRDAALADLGASLLEGARDGRDLFLALVDFDRFAASPGADRGLVIASLTLNGPEAVLTTVGGESFRFVKQAEGWKSAVFESQIEASVGLKRLRANLDVAEANLASWDRAVQETTDRSKPEGAFNVLFESVKRGARVMVFELLDPKSRELLTSGLAAAVSLQGALEKRYPTAAERTRYLTDKKLVWLERVADEKALFAALWDGGALAADLPAATDGEIADVKMSGADTTVISVKGATPSRSFTFVRDLAKRWCFAGLQATLEREGLRRLEAEQRALPAAPAAAAPAL